MRNRYRQFRRSWGTYYAFDNLTRQQFTLETKDPHAAQELLQTRNEASREPLLNRQKGTVEETLDMATGLDSTEHDEPNHDSRTNPRQGW